MPIISTYPDKVHKEAQHIIGEEHQDRLGFKWAYVEFTAGTYNFGHVVRDQSPDDFLGNSGVGTVTAAAAIGTNILQDTGEFANKDLRGAIGVITGEEGVGQVFQVLEHDDNELQIAVLKSEASKRGWETALTTSSTYQLTIPGRVELAGASEYNARGVVQYKDAFTVPTGELRYGYVRKTGIGEGLLDVSGNAITASGLIIPVASGLVAGVPSTLTVVALSQVIGKALQGDISGTTDVTIPIDFRITNNAQSFRRPRLREEPKFTVE